MPPKPPHGNQKEYTLRPPRVYADQYLAGSPLPAGAVPSLEPLYPAAGGPYANTTTGVYPLHDTDWILTDTYTGQPTLALSEADFQLQYVKATGPPAPLPE
jgi:hypothetical protein